MPKYYFNGQVYDSEYLAHYGRKGMKWGKNIFVTPDNTTGGTYSRRAAPRLLLKKRNSRGYINPRAAWSRPNQRGYFDKDNPIDNNGLHERDSRDIGRYQQDELSRTMRDSKVYTDYSDSSLQYIRDKLYERDLTKESDQEFIKIFNNSGIAYMSHIRARAAVSAINRELEDRKLVNKVKNWASNLVKTTTSAIKNTSAYKLGASIVSRALQNKPLITTEKTISVGRIPNSVHVPGVTAYLSAQKAIAEKQKQVYSNRANGRKR